MRYKSLVLPLAALTVLFAGSASAGIVGSTKNHHQSAVKESAKNKKGASSSTTLTTSLTQVTHHKSKGTTSGIQNSVNTLIKAKKTPGSGSSTQMVLAALSTPVKHGSKHKAGKGVSIPVTQASFVGGSPLAPAPEPASTSLILFGLFGAGLAVRRRFQAQRT
jgi:hypothetical protein